MGWKQSGNTIGFSFDNGYTASVVKNERKIIQDAIRDIVGEDYVIDVDVVQTRKTETADDEQEENTISRQVDAVKKVFRGEIIQE